MDAKNWDRVALPFGIETGQLSVNQEADVEEEGTSLSP
jgi:hypothetical protein